MPYEMQPHLRTRATALGRKVETSLTRLDRLLPALRKQANDTLDAALAHRRAEEERERGRAALQQIVRTNREQGLG